MSFEVPAAWESRFAFFDQYGYPGSTPESKAAFRALSFGQRYRLQQNGPGIFFGAFYFLVKGMWRKGITLLVLDLVVGAVAAELNMGLSLSNAIGIGLALLAGMTANYSYYLHVTQHSTSWNPFEGSGRKRR